MIITVIALGLVQKILAETMSEPKDFIVLKRTTKCIDTRKDKKDPDDKEEEPAPIIEEEMRRIVEDLLNSEDDANESPEDDPWNVDVSNKNEDNDTNRTSGYGLRSHDKDKNPANGAKGTLPIKNKTEDPSENAKSSPDNQPRNDPYPPQVIQAILHRLTIIKTVFVRIIRTTLQRRISIPYNTTVVIKDLIRSIETVIKGPNAKQQVPHIVKQIAFELFKFQERIKGTDFPGKDENFAALMSSLKNLNKIVKGSAKVQE